MCLLMLGCVCVGAYEYIYPRLTLKCVLCSLSIFHTETGYISLNSEFTDYNSLVSQFVWRIPVSCSEGYNRVIDEPWYSLIIYMGAGFKSCINKHPSFIDGFFLPDMKNSAVLSHSFWWDTRWGRFRLRLPRRFPLGGRYCLQSRKLAECKITHDWCSSVSFCSS